MLPPDLLSLHRDLCAATGILCATDTRTEADLTAALATFERAIAADESGAVDLPAEFLPFAAHLLEAATRRKAFFGSRIDDLAARAAVALATFTSRSLA